MHIEANLHGRDLRIRGAKQHKLFHYCRGRRSLVGSLTHSAWDLPMANICTRDTTDSPVSPRSGLTFGRCVTPSGGRLVTESNTKHTYKLDKEFMLLWNLQCYSRMLVTRIVVIISGRSGLMQGSRKPGRRVGGATKFCTVNLNI
jgi:hypothetical protein